MTTLLGPLVRQLQQALSPANCTGTQAPAAAAPTAPRRPLPKVELQRQGAILRLVRDAGQIPLPLLIKLSAVRLEVSLTTVDKSIRTMRQDGVLADAPIMYESRATFMITEGSNQ